jgi:hypothetical protein
MITEAAIFTTSFAALYVGHHVGDYWVQTDHQAKHKGAAGREGRDACGMHVITYLFTQLAFLVLVQLTLGISNGHWWSVLLSLAVSGLTHYAADRREHGLMFKLARLLPGKVNFLKLGVPREPWALEVLTPCSACHQRGRIGAGVYSEPCSDCFGQGSIVETLTRADNPSLGTGAWALDQSWHIALGVFVPALILAF